MKKSLQDLSLCGQDEDNVAVENESWNSFSNQAEISLQQMK